MFCRAASAMRHEMSCFVMKEPCRRSPSPRTPAGRAGASRGRGKLHEVPALPRIGVRGRRCAPAGTTDGGLRARSSSGFPGFASSAWVPPFEPSSFHRSRSRFPRGGGTLIRAYPARAPAPVGARFAPARFARLIARACPGARAGRRAHLARWPNRRPFFAPARTGKAMRPRADAAFLPRRHRSTNGEMSILFRRIITKFLGTRYDSRSCRVRRRGPRCRPTTYSGGPATRRNADALSPKHCFNSRKGLPASA